MEGDENVISTGDTKNKQLIYQITTYFYEKVKRIYKVNILIDFTERKQIVEEKQIRYCR